MDEQEQPRAGMGAANSSSPMWPGLSLRRDRRRNRIAVFGRSV